MSDVVEKTEPSFEGHCSYKIQGANHKILGLELHGCTHWHAEVCHKNADDSEKHRAAIFADEVVRIDFVRSIDTIVTAVSVSCTVPVCDCVCHWVKLQPKKPVELPPTVPPKRKKNGKKPRK